MYTNIGTDVVQLGPTDDYDKLQEEGSTHQSVKVSSVALTDNRGDVYVLILSNGQTTLQQVPNARFNTDTLTQEVGGFTQDSTDMETTIHIFRNRLVAYSYRSYTTTVNLSSSSIASVKTVYHDGCLIYGNGVKAIVPGVGKAYPQKEVLQFDLPEVYGKFSKIKTVRYELLDITGRHSIFNSPGLVGTNLEHFLLTVKRVLVRGTTFAAPIAYEEVENFILTPQSRDMIMNQYSRWLYRPLLYIWNICELYMTHWVGVTPKDLPSPPPDLIGELAYMSALSGNYGTLNVVQYVEPGFSSANTAFVNPAQQETQLSSSHLTVFHFTVSYTYPFVSLILRPKYGSFVLVLNRDKTTKTELFPYTTYSGDRYKPANSAQFFYTYSCLQEEYAIIEGLFFAKVYMSDFKKFRDRAGEDYEVAHKTQIMCMTASGTIKVCKETDECHRWKQGDLTLWTSDFVQLEKLVGKFEVPDKIDYMPNANVIELTQNTPVLFDLTGEQNFLYSVSSTEVLSNLDNRLTEHLFKCLYNSEWNTVLHIPVYVVMNVCHEMDTTMRTTPASVAYYANASYMPLLDQKGWFYNQGRSQAYSHYNNPHDFTMVILRYDVSFSLPKLPEFEALVVWLDKYGIKLPPKNSLQGSLLTRLDITIKKNDTFSISFSDSIKFTASPPQLLWMHTFHDYGSFSKVYLDKDGKLYTHTASKIIVYDTVHHTTDILPLKLELTEQSSQGTQKMVVPVRIVADMRKFVEIIKQCFIDKTTQQNQTT